MRHRHLTMIFLLSVLLTACWGEVPDGQTVPCFQFDGEEVCTEPGDDISINLGFSPEEADGWIVRLHPEDAARYGFPETTPVEPNERTGRSRFILVRTGLSPATVCPLHDIYLQDPIERMQVRIYEAGACLVGLPPNFSDRVWVPITE